MVVLFDCSTRKAIREMLINKCFEARDEFNRIPHGLAHSLVLEYREQFPFITDAVLRNGICRRRKREGNVQVSPPVQAQQRPEIIEPNLGGRPVGTGKHKQRLDKLAYQNLVNVAATRLRDRHGHTKSPFPPGLAEEVISEVKGELGMPDADVKPGTVQQRVRRGKTENFGRGNPSPTRRLDEAVCQIIIQLADMRQCITREEGIGLVNSLIKDTEIEKEIVEFKLSMNMRVDQNGKNKDGNVLGYRWWITFLKRNSHRLVSTKGRKFAVARDTWCIWTNFADMYDHVYDAMVDAKVAEKLDEPAWLDLEGNTVDEKDSVGRKSTHRLNHPQMAVVVDETGCNTSMKNDGNGCNRKYVGRAGETPQLRASECDNHYTTMCFTALNGEPVLSLTIFKGEPLKL